MALDTGCKALLCLKGNKGVRAMGKMIPGEARQDAVTRVTAVS